MIEFKDVKNYYNSSVNYNLKVGTSKHGNLQFMLYDGRGYGERFVLSFKRHESELRYLSILINNILEKDKKHE